MKNTKFKLLFISLLLALSFTGCKDKENEKALLTYKTEVTKFYDTINVETTKINKIKYTDEASKEELLEELDKVSAAFDEFSSVEIPSQFEEIDKLTLQSAEFMTDAVNLYHEALDGEEIDEETAKKAQKKYNQAIECINCIGSVLKGEEPDDGNLKTIE